MTRHDTTHTRRVHLALARTSLKMLATYAQGYHIGRPQPAQQIVDALETARPARW